MGTGYESNFVFLRKISEGRFGGSQEDDVENDTRALDWSVVAPQVWEHVCYCNAFFARVRGLLLAMSPHLQTAAHEQVRWDTYPPRVYVDERYI